VGSPGVLPQSDTEAYLWAKRAAEQGLAKAEYAMGYFTEAGIGTIKDFREAMSWFERAAQHGDKRAAQRLIAARSGSSPIPLRLQSQSPERRSSGGSYQFDLSSSDQPTAGLSSPRRNSMSLSKSKNKEDCIIS